MNQALPRHENVFQALQHIEFLQMDVDCIEDRTAKVEKLEQGVAEFLAYIRNDRAHISNYGERYRHDETISAGFVESTVNQVPAPWILPVGEVPALLKFDTKISPELSGPPDEKPFGTNATP
jgi:hypothetical protein